MKSVSRVASCILVSMALAGHVAAAQQRFITEMDLHKFLWIADAQISPDGSHIVFVRVSVNAKGDGYDTALWLVPANASEQPRQLTGGPRDLAPRWSRDRRQIAFLRALEKDGKPQPSQIFLLSMQGGEARQFTNIPKGAGAHEWSPDGKMMVFTSTYCRKTSNRTPIPDTRLMFASSRGPCTAPTDQDTSTSQDTRISGRCTSRRFPERGHLEATHVRRV